MAKKKKTQLKPVARGFATVSVAKKVLEVESEAEATPSQAEESTPAQGSESSGHSDTQPGQDA